MISFSQFAKVAAAAMLFDLAACWLSAQTPAPADRSPFLPEGTSTAAGAATENTPIEYRGVVSTKRGDMFALYDPAKHQSVWVRLNEAGSDFVVRSNDANSDTITVDYQGRRLTLALKQAKVETMAVSAPPMAPSTPNGIRPPNTPGAAPNAAEEQRRLEAVAAEVRRRRMLRAQAAGAQPPMPQNTPAR